MRRIKEVLRLKSRSVSDEPCRAAAIVSNAVIATTEILISHSYESLLGVGSGLAAVSETWNSAQPCSLRRYSFESLHLN
jgi:hypothetical protein